MSRTPRNLAVPLLAATVLVLAACESGSGAAAGSGGDQKAAAQSGGLPGEHVHGVARDPGDGTVYLATHEGLFRYDKGAPVRVGPVVDWMGFSIAGPGHFYTSGHPGDGVDLPAPVGLMESTDAGKTWSVRSLGGKSDFHALASSSKGVLAYDGTLRSTADGETWTKLAISAEPTSLAAAPDGSRILATTASSVLLSSDQGATWAPLPAAPPLLLAAWADKTTATGVTTTGHLAVTTNAGATWTTGTARVDSAQAISASRANGGTLGVLLVTDSGVQRSIDSGASFSPLVTN
jgi:photosystem II stability/assembly factor-like uncharacterized protein